jgi:hypothetical protein
MTALILIFGCSQISEWIKVMLNKQAYGKLLLK